MHELIKYTCDELKSLEDKVARGQKLSMSEVQYMDTLAHAKKNLLKGEEMEEGEYSGRMMYDEEPYSRNSYARRRDSMGRYSRYDEQDYRMR